MKNTNSAALRARRRIGANVLAYFPALMSQNTAAKMLGLTASHVAFIEREAAWKVYIRMREIIRKERNA